MRTCCATLLVLLTVSCAYHNPEAPSTTAPPISSTAPFSLTLGATVGMGADAGRAVITAKVQNVNGAVLPGITVQFATDVGTLSESSVVTGAEGTASTTITSSTTAALTATAGTLTTKTLVVSQPTVTPPTAPPAPAPAPDPPGAGPLSVTLSAADVTLKTQTIVVAQVKNGPPQSLTWSFGDGTTFAGTSTTTAHTYAAVGSYVVGVTVRDTNGRTASGSTTANVIAAPPPPPTGGGPPAGPSITVTVKASPDSVVAGSTSTITATANPQNGATAVTMYTFDCDSNGTNEATAIGSNIFVCTYPTDGSFTAKVTASDGTTSGSGTVDVTVTVAPPPTIKVSCNTGVKVSVTSVKSSCVVSATVRGAVVPSSSITGVTWDFGDSSPPQFKTGNVSPDHSYAAANTYTVFATATITGVTGPVTGSVETTIEP